MPPLGQRVAAEIADDVIMEGCASTTEVRAFRAAVEDAARKADGDPRGIRIIAKAQHLQRGRRPSRA
jgi:alkanesulfonate monooxygenase SsuD/methylene tetrahydromethanopterin reductase-like flavin-dependent oxidoreductase (luciferase family)